MTRKEQFERNLAFFTEFNLFLLEYPEFEAQLPDQAVIIFIPADDPALAKANRKLIEAHQAEREQVVVVRVGPLEHFRLRKIEPMIELLAA